MLSLGIAMVRSSRESGTFCEFRIGSLVGLGKAPFLRLAHLPDHASHHWALHCRSREWWLPGGPVPFTAWLGLDPLSLLVLSKMARLGYRTPWLFLLNLISNLNTSSKN